MKVTIARGELRRELRGVASKARWFGLALTAIGAALYVAPRFDDRWWMLGPVPSQPLAVLALMAGWAMLGYVVGRRTEHVRHRMAAVSEG